MARVSAGVALLLGSALVSAVVSALAPALAASALRPAAPVSRWRVVDPATPAPVSGTRTVELAPAPRSAIIPVEAGPPSAIGAKGAEAALPADAAVVAAPIRPPYRLRPSLSGGVPTGFVGSWGDYFLAGSAGTPGNLREGSPDGSLNLGFGLGDPERFLGADVFWGIGSIRNFNDNGAFGGAVGRLLVRRPDLVVAAAGGVVEAFSYGTEANPQPANGYGALSVALPLRPADPVFPQMVQFTAGGGGSSFAAVNASFQTDENGVFGAAGLEVTPNIGVSVGMSSRGTNVNLSWIPLRDLPVFVNVMAADVFSDTPWGTVGVLSIGWG
ncbi:MAG: hypothetical protein VKP63_11685, partial [Cyanobacteriota bacterium]|nr:hypothetical protein [Cyanobacteriota bacterium]